MMGFVSRLIRFCLFAGVGVMQATSLTHARDDVSQDNQKLIQSSDSPQLASSSVSLTSLPAQVRQRLASAGVPAEAMSVIVQPVGESTPLLRYRSNKKRLPASTLKIVTTFAALDALGPDFRWTTRVYHTGYIKQGVLHGDLIIKGGGDPKLVREYVEAMYVLVKQRGVQHIDGNIVLDTSVFGRIRHNPAAFDGKPLRPYNAAPSGLLVNFNSVVFNFVPDAVTGIARVGYEPAMAGVTFDAQVGLSSGACGAKSWQQSLQASFTDTNVTFDGSYPTRCKSRNWAVVLPKPRTFAPRVFHGMWLASGGTLSGKVFYGKKTSSAKKLVNYRSLPLRHIIKDINHFSNNVMTEQVFLSLPVYARQGRFTHQGTYGNARRWMSTWWRQHLPKSVRPRMSKASGLCRDCHVPVSSLNALLQLAAAHRHADVFKRSLGVAGHSGTIKSFKYRKPKSPANGRAYIKTGTLDDVTGIAGYVESREGAQYTVVGIIHHPQAGKARAALDELMDWVAKR